MKIVRYQSADGIHYGVETQGRVERIAGDPFKAIERTGEVDHLSNVRLLCPVDRPRIFGVAYNYREHTSESGKEQPTLPVLFMKPSTAASGNGDAIEYPRDGEIVHYEAELVAIIGKGGRHIGKEDALQHVLGYTCGNDISDRIIQRQESKFGCLLAGKGYDTFAPMGPAIITDLDPGDLDVILRQNGIVKQSGNTRDLVYSVADIVAYLSRFMTLLPGDVIMTGTPAGVGPIQPGDELEVEIPGIGILNNPVVAASHQAQFCMRKDFG
ncbi:fumarylacetoacetate hydrolase [Rhizobium leguminosarum bv. trifolii]|uniref:Fumarylacetoacetate hydrolase n=1 Tax=Rhizobium leguminosarum bv. trifolii TaxID=386 RepID=A0A3E1BYB8_RHILT|nr:fumarylacetoacetate hydrolase family protein [Rhizobium leguminosarum]RFB98964.1 fumarylacetoacetate hydrolase [Rhizobium leguminosarum bv. trifolii]RFC00066.1 fumarylacetoacetate hydrolase [Rhizobium leguminosarum bv. trifolii]